MKIIHYEQNEPNRQISSIEKSFDIKGAKLLAALQQC